MYWRRKRVHPMWKIAAICVGIIVGVGGARWFDVADSWWYGAVIVLLIGVWFGKRCWVILIAFSLGLCIGIERGRIELHAQAVFQPVIGRHVQVEGRVMNDPDTNRQGELTLTLGGLTANGHHLSGKLWVTTANRPGIQRSDRLVVDGKLAPGFGGTTVAIKSARVISVQREHPGDIALSVRDDFAEHVLQAIDGPAADLGMGYLLGQKRDLPENLVSALKIAGLTHVVVASGYNLTVLVRLARRLFEKASKYLAAFCSVMMIGGFLAITGLSPSMARAGLVSLLALWAWYFGRRFHPVVLLSLAGAVTLMVKPSYIWGDLGWELSFAAFAGVMIVAPLIHAYFYGNDQPHWVPQILIETVSAQLMTLPLILMVFGQLSNIAPLANLMIVPLVPVAMLLVFVAGVGAYLAPPFAHVIGWPAQMLLDAMIGVIHWCADLTWAQTTLQLQWWGALLWYIVVMVACVVMWRVTRYRFFRSSIIE